MRQTGQPWSLVQMPPESFRYISKSSLDSVRGLADIPSESMKLLTALSLSEQSLHSNASNVEHGPSLTPVLQSRSLLLGMSRYRHSPFRTPNFMCKNPDAPVPTPNDVPVGKLS